MENTLITHNQNELSIKESNFHESENNTSITMSMSISMEGQAKRKKEERIKSLKLAKEFPKIEKITHNTSDRNINEPHENSDIHFINMINFKNLFQANFDQKISEFEKLSDFQEKEIIDLMFILHNLKGEIEAMNLSLGQFLLKSQCQISKHLKTLKSPQPDELLNKSSNSNNTLNSSRRSVSFTNKSKFGEQAISTKKKEIAKEKFKMFSPKVFINIAPPSNINENIKNFNLKFDSGEAKPNFNNKLNINNPITDKIMNNSKTNKSTNYLTYNNQKKSNQTTPKKEVSKFKNTNYYNSLKMPAKENLISVNKNLFSSGSNKNSHKAITNTSSNSVNKFITIHNERKQSNNNLTEQVKKTAYKLAPKKKSEYSKDNMMTNNCSNPSDMLNHKFSVMMPIRIKQNNSEVAPNFKIQSRITLDNCNYQKNKNENSNANDLDRNIQINSLLFKLINMKNSKNVFFNIFSFLNVKNKLKNINKNLRQNFIEFQIKKIEDFIAEQNKNIEEAIRERKSSLLELILETEILSHRESKLKTILNHHWEFYN